MARSIMWFRRDLRLADHPALSGAAAEGGVVALFVVDPRFTSRAGRPRLAFLADSLRDLHGTTGGALVIRHGDPVEVVPRVVDEVGAGQVVVTDDFGPYGRRRDAAVATALGDRCPLVLVDAPYAVAPGHVGKRDGDPYSVFTPYRRAWRDVGWAKPVEPPQVDWVEAASDDLPRLDGTGVSLPPAGEAAAHERLDAFLMDAVDHYDTRRNEPGVDGTSRLSPYLRWGALHPRQILDQLGPSQAHTAFTSELAWREFYADVLFHHPRSAWENLGGRLDRMPVDTGSRALERFAAWAGARTGYPFVDAGLRQLHATGWMHNRVRMATASFLVKDLHLPWQWGARHFLDHLVDGDLASNQHGWQWVAGTGTDAAPYFRVFNPVSQGERFDPDGTYVRRWLPELEGVPDPYVHRPWTSPRGLPLGYPPPMVDHAEEREEALRRYRTATSR
jgi:deoxyribodipyrimidine photo-lyase